MVITKTKKAEFDYKAASSEALADFGGTADYLIKRNAAVADAIKTELRERAGNHANSDVMTVTGEAYVAVVGKVPQKAAIKDVENTDIIEMVGQDVFNALASFPVGRLKDYLSKKDFDALCGEPEDGTRSVSFKERSNG